MVTAVITGSTKGIGRGLAAEFIKRGHNAVICSRNLRMSSASPPNSRPSGPGKCTGVACDTTDKQQVQALWDHGVSRFGRVDIWINNAGRASSRHKVHELPEELTRTLITCNLIGTTFGSQVAITGFREQGGGALYNVLGGSFDGKRLVPNMGVYSSTKAGIHLLTKYLIDENKDQNITIGMISPGMLITENWFDEQAELSEEEWQKIRHAERPLRSRGNRNALADRRGACKHAKRQTHRLDVRRQNHETLLRCQGAGPEARSVFTLQSLTRLGRRLRCIYSSSISAEKDIIVALAIMGLSYPRCVNSRTDGGSCISYLFN